MVRLLSFLALFVSPIVSASYLPQGVVRSDTVIDGGTNGITTIQTGTYTPTLTNGSNVGSSVFLVSSWQRIGKVVTVYLRATIDPTAASSTETNLNITLPFDPGANFASENEVFGVASQVGSPAQVGIIRSVVGARTAQLVFNAENANNRNWAASFTYLIQ